MQIFRDRLSALFDEAEANGTSRAEIARRVDIAPNRLYNYVNTMREPSYEVLAKLCRVLNTHPSYLLGFSDSRKWPPEDVQLSDLEAKIDQILKREN